MKKLLFLIVFLCIFVSLESSSLGGNKNIYLTIDLCPSNRPYEKKLFDYLENLGKKLEKPVPVAIAVSGTWILHHQDELEDIKSRYLDITWVNHSYSHPVENDFLNNPEVDFVHEVAANDKLMIENDLKPSLYFRFPGLKYDDRRLAQLKKMGYINLDADAWLAKGQEIKDGSIVLIHGNGNEVSGVIDKFISYLKVKQPLLMPLSPQQLPQDVAHNKVLLQQ